MIIIVIIIIIIINNNYSLKWKWLLVAIYRAMKGLLHTKTVGKWSRKMMIFNSFTAPMITILVHKLPNSYHFLPVSSINSSQTDKALPAKTSKPNFVSRFVYFGNGLFDYLWNLFVCYSSVLRSHFAHWAEKWWFLSHLLLPMITILAHKLPNSYRVFLPTNKTFVGSCLVLSSKGVVNSLYIWNHSVKITIKFSFKLIYEHVSWMK